MAVPDGFEIVDFVNEDIAPSGDPERDCTGEPDPDEEDGHL